MTDEVLAFQQRNSCVAPISGAIPRRTVRCSAEQAFKPNASRVEGMSGARRLRRCYRRGAAIRSGPPVRSVTTCLSSWSM